MMGVMEVELREYRIRRGQMDAWIASWKAQIVPLRQEAGFSVMGAWVDAPYDRFVWLLGYAGEDGFAAADARYYESPRRMAVHPEPTELIEEATNRMVEAVM
jgi:NIPSNAP